MNLTELVNALKTDKNAAPAIDSRAVCPGGIFAAITGTNADGHDYIDQALAAGAKYIIAEKHVPCPGARLIIVPNSAQALARVAQALKDNPAQKLINLAVTGTNGKTTVAWFVHQIIKHTGSKCGLVGTILYDTAQTTIPAPLTTPDCLQIADLTEQMVAGGCRYAVYEASSHALAQHRLAGLDFKAAAFTNLSGDHLDYHQSQENYLAAKSLLFENLDDAAVAVLNKQSAQAEIIAGKTSAAIMYYAVDAPAELWAQTISQTDTGSHFTLRYQDQSCQVKTPLLGNYNISNCLAAAGLCLSAGLPLDDIARGLSNASAVPGRLEKVPAGPHAPTVLIDYAHTDDALRNVLETLRPICKGDLAVVFGCGGDRDQSKRPRMAAVAEQLADKIYITSDNPRTESPNIIIGQIMVGFENPVAENIFIEPERKRAIDSALKAAGPEDIILIAGKGHETYQILGDQRIHFSDLEAAADALEKYSL